MTVIIQTMRSRGIPVGINSFLTDVEIYVRISDFWENKADEPAVSL